MFAEEILITENPAMPTATGSEMLGVLLGIMALVVAVNYVVSLVNGIKQLRAAPVMPLELQYVTHAEFATFKAEIVSKLDDLKKQQLEKVGDVKVDISKLDVYMHEAIHRISNTIQSSTIKLERLLVMQEIAGGKIKGRPGDPSNAETSPFTP